jgi:hypothetical protein
MSTAKTPQEKKKLSLERDRRNTYGENAKSSRKNIPLSKRLSQKAVRHTAKVPLEATIGLPDEDEVVTAESKLRSDLTKKRRRAFKKRPDQPLGLVLEKKFKSKNTAFKAQGDLRARKRRGEF